MKILVDQQGANLLGQIADAALKNTELGGMSMKLKVDAMQQAMAQSAKVDQEARSLKPPLKKDDEPED